MIKTRFITHTGLFLALAVLLPVGFHAFGASGRIFLPMHIPPLLAGFLIGPLSGVIVGILAPGLSHLLTGMPPTYAVPLMSLELPIYGLVAGMAYKRLNLNIYVSLIVALLFGRIMFAFGLLVLGLFMNLPYGVSEFIAGGAALVHSLPGVVIQIVAIPVLVASLKRFYERK